LLPSTGFSESYRLSDFVVVNPTRIEKQYVVSGKVAAQEVGCLMERCLQFMQATGLRPSRAWSRTYPTVGYTDDSHAIPSSDHMSCWYHPATRSFVLSDEPYEADASMPNTVVERGEWCERHRMQTVKPIWAGMYNPDGGSRLYLFTRTSAVDLAELARALDKLGQPTDVFPWRGKST
jgi:hypothetical protein